MAVGQVFGRRLYPFAEVKDLVVKESVDVLMGRQVYGFLAKPRELHLQVEFILDQSLVLVEFEFMFSQIVETQKVSVCIKGLLWLRRVVGLLG